MSNTADMSTPVTRGELQEELAKLATKAELEIWGSVLLARIQSSEHGLRELREETRQLVKSTEQELRDLVKTTEQGLRELIKANHKELQADLAMHAGALFESMSALIRGLDDKYKDLPDRVARIEAKVFKRKRR